MKCPICVENLEIVEKTTDDFNRSTVTKYAICRDCKKQWKVKTATKADSPSPSKKPLIGKGREESQQAKVEKISDDDLFLADAGVNPAKSKAGEREEKPKKQGKRPSESNKKDKDIGRDRRARKSREKSRDRTKDEDKPRSKDRGKDKNKDREVRAKAHKNRTSTGGRVYDDYTPMEESKVAFKPIRILIAVLSILAFVYLLYQGVYVNFFDHIIGQAQLSIAIAMIALGTLSLIAGLVLLFTLKKNGILPFILPAILYLIGGVVAFLFRGDSTILLAGSIVPLIVAILLIILILVEKVKSED